jgi:hypothetical protein
MKPVRALLALSITAAVIGLVGCKKEPTPTTTGAPTTAPAGETADQFIARVNDEYRKMYPEMTAAQWLSSTYINDDSQLLSAKANERYLAQLKSWIDQARRFEGQQMSPQTARSIQLLKLFTSMPPPKDPAKLEELTKIATRMEGMYGAGTYCRGEGDDKQCRQLGDLEDVLRNSRDYDEQLEAWQGWHTISKLRHDAGGNRRRNRSPVEPGQAAVRTAALLRAHAPGSEVRHRSRPRGRQHAARAPDGQHVAAGLGQPVGHPGAVPERQHPRDHQRAGIAVPRHA